MLLTRTTAFSFYYQLGWVITCVMRMACGLTQWTAHARIPYVYAFE
jgi:hypothetical protein